jgi:hypothetical protein
MNLVAIAFPNILDDGEEGARAKERRGSRVQGVEGSSGGEGGRQKSEGRKQKAELRRED